MDKEKLYNLKLTKEYRRLGKLFYTSKNAYFYDTGTGKTVKLDRDSVKLFESLFNEQVNNEDFIEVLNGIDHLEALLAFIEKEHLLCNPPVTELGRADLQFSEDIFKCGQLIIELTGNCNLRCKYCIYNDFYEGNRNFNTSNIDFETARKAIDYAYAHRDSKHFAVTFYGGEPLLNFPVMKQCFDYCLENFPGENISFSFTTNLTLMTEEIAEYLAQIPNMGILVSIDGPEEIHNMARVKTNGKGSFQDAFRGLKILSQAINKYKNTKLTFSSVLMPPYTAERFNIIDDFFEGLTFLPEDTEIMATYPTDGTVSEIYLSDLQKKGIEVKEEVQWTDWALAKWNSASSSATKRNLYSRVLEDALAKVHNRPLYEKPISKFYRNGCCVPGKRRLYVCTDGSYRVCERIGNAPVIGNVDSGINVDTVISKYIREYDKESLPDCSKCWAINLCTVCYAMCFDEQGINIDKKRVECSRTRKKCAAWLQCYYELLETHPEKIEKISKIELS